MGSQRILVVDDDADIREALEGLLLAEGYAVATATNGAEALEALRADAGTALVLLDLMMPVMSGWEFCERKTADPSVAAVPVVVLSAVSKLNQGACPGAVGYLSKPIDVERLLATVSRYVQPTAR